MPDRVADIHIVGVYENNPRLVSKLASIRATRKLHPRRGRQITAAVQRERVCQTISANFKTSGRTRGRSKASIPNLDKPGQSEAGKPSQRYLPNRAAQFSTTTIGRSICTPSGSSTRNRRPSRPGWNW